PHRADPFQQQEQSSQFLLDRLRLVDRQALPRLVFDDRLSFPAARQPFQRLHRFQLRRRRHWPLRPGPAPSADHQAPEQQGGPETTLSPHRFPPVTRAGSRASRPNGYLSKARDGLIARVAAARARRRGHCPLRVPFLLSRLLLDRPGSPLGFLLVEWALARVL